MPGLNRKAGQNIRILALKRKIEAVGSFGAAGIIIFFPYFFYKQVLVSNSPLAPKIEPPLYLYGVFIVMSLFLIINGISLWHSAGRATQGAKGEEDVALEVVQLEQEGWQIEYGVLLGGRLGDADIICTSPEGKVYVIDVKSHRGEVSTDGKRLLRHFGKDNFQFEKDFLAQSMKQALQLKKQKNLSFVTPILAFAKAKVLVSTAKLRGVYVVEKSRLVPLLRSLG